MALTDWVTARAFRSPELRIGLELAGIPPADEGYLPQRPRFWRVEGSEASAEVAFGPFRGQVDVDTVTLMDGEGRILHRHPIGSTRLAAGQRLVWEHTVEVADG